MMYVGHPRCTWYTQGVRGTPKMNVDIQTNLEALKEIHLSLKCTWDTQDVRGTLMMYVGHSNYF